MLFWRAQAAVAGVPALLANFSLERVCRMRQHVRSAYEQFLQSPAHWIAALRALDAMRGVASNGSSLQP